MKHYLEGWFLFATERNQIFSFIQKHQVDGVVLLSADAHWSGVWEHTLPSLPGIESRHIYEVSASPLNAFTLETPYCDFNSSPISSKTTSSRAIWIAGKFERPVRTHLSIFAHWILDTSAPDGGDLFLRFYHIDGQLETYWPHELNKLPSEQQRHQQQIRLDPYNMFPSAWRSGAFDNIGLPILALRLSAGASKLESFFPPGQKGEGNRAPNLNDAALPRSSFLSHVVVSANNDGRTENQPFTVKTFSSFIVLLQVMGVFFVIFLFGCRCFSKRRVFDQFFGRTVVESRRIQEERQGGNGGIENVGRYHSPSQMIRRRGQPSSPESRRDEDTVALLDSDSSRLSASSPTSPST